MALSITVLRNRDFRCLLLARVTGLFGLQAQAVIVGWQIYTLTHDVFMLGLVGLAEAVPAILFALISGHVVDVGRPHRIYVLCFAALALNAALLFLIGGDLLTMANDARVAALFACVFFSGIARSFIVPSSFTLLSRIVPRTQMSAASAWMGSGFQLAAILGPALAGIIYGGYGAHVAWMIPLAALLIGFVMTLLISKPHRQHRNTHKNEPALVSIKAGWRFILGHKVLLSVMSLSKDACRIVCLVALALAGSAPGTPASRRLQRVMTVHLPFGFGTLTMPPCRASPPGTSMPRAAAMAASACPRPGQCPSCHPPSRPRPAARR